MASDIRPSDSFDWDYALALFDGKNKCRKGLHTMTLDNTYINKQGWRRCRACIKASKGTT